MLLFILSLAQAYKVILFTRHGARSPDPFTEVDKKQWNIPSNRLTQNGYDSFLKLGQRFQNYQIYDNLGNCIYETLEIQASITQRAVMSTMGLIKGLCPRNYEEILRRYFNEYYHQYSTSDKKFKKIIDSDFSDPMSLDVTFFERQNDFMFHGSDEDVCPALKAIRKAKKGSDYYLAKDAELRAQNEFDDIVALLKQANPSEDIKKKNVNIADLEHFYDNYECNRIQGNPFPNPTQADVDLLEEAVRVMRYYVDHSDPLEEFSNLSEPFQWLIKQLSNDQPLSVYSGHGQNLEAFIAVFSSTFRPVVQFASYMEIVIHDEGFINIFYNGVQMKTNICPKQINCSLKELAGFLSKYIATDLYKLCGVKQVVE